MADVAIKKLAEKYQIPNLGESFSNFKSFFEMADNGDGKLTKEEAAAVISSEDIDPIFKKYCTDGSDTLTIKGFIKAMFMPSIQDHWQGIFWEYAADGESGYHMDHEEIDAFFASVGITGEDAEKAIKYMLDNFDKNKDGKFSFQEFIEFLDDNLGKAIDEFLKN
ncbi:uncharacterized protein LOC141901218 [Tubulanus polymorphus]|uniref:uncharacterized protein LOC141901218 n=1 Tax=Tubulanus polymorphus TaxID=672921 RepID=UPI003DA493C1